jgi:predicted esterase
MESIREHHIPVSRTARYCTLGDPQGEPRELWYVCHGYGQLAARFLRRFTALDAGGRLIVAPEALSRFYIERPGRTHAHSPVGASWMTREDRLSEIDDYIRFLDALHAQLVRPHSGARPPITVLGFSQGVATACRWLARGSVQADRLILWGSLIPPDLDLDSYAPVFRALDLLIVAGDADPHLGVGSLAEQEARLAKHAIPYSSVTYSGGHEILGDVLEKLVV